MGRILKYSLSCFVVSVFLMTQVFADPWADEVIAVEYGLGAGYGQDYFPDNILGPPDTAATVLYPSASERELLTLGRGGSIILAFNDGGIDNGPGPDFTVFENVFLHMGEFPFQETAFVEVSEDGESWTRFPYDGETLVGLAGVSPTVGNADPTDPSVSGGDSFDLADLGLSHITYIKLIDTEGFVTDGGPSFDLDAVVVVNGEQRNGVEPVDRLINEPLLVKAWPNPFNSRLTLQIDNNRGDETSLSVFDLLGREVYSAVLPENFFSWEPSDLKSGLYLIRVSGTHGQSTVTKVYYLK